MGLKTSFLDKLSGDGIEAEWLTRVVPSLDDLPTPGTVEESTLAIATYCDNCNKIMQLYEGVPIIELALRAGQMSATAQALVLSGLERNKNAGGSTPGDLWHWFVGVPGWPDTALYEQFKGIGSDYHSEDISDIYDALGTWGTSLKSWIEGFADQITAAEEAYIAGTEYSVAFDAGTIPVIVLPAPGDTDNPSALWQVVKWVSLIFASAWGPLIVEIARWLFRRATQGESLSPLLKILRKALLIKDGDSDQGMPDHTALLLLNADKPIELYNAEGVRDVFLDPRVREGDE